MATTKTMKRPAARRSRGLGWQELTEAARSGTIPFPSLSREAKAILLRRVTELHLPRRAVNALTGARIVYLGDLLTTPDDDLAHLRGYGRETRRVIRTELERLGLPRCCRIPGWDPAEAGKLEKQLEPELDRLRAEEVVAQLPEPKKKLPLEERMLAFVRLYTTDRNARLVCRVLGWDGTGPHTMYAAAEQFGLTRERVRQILEVLFERYFGRLKPTLLPWMQDAVRFVEKRIPDRADAIERALAEAGITAKPFRLEGFISTFEMEQRQAPFEIWRSNGTRFAVAPKDVRVCQRIWATACRLTEGRGCARVRQLVRELPGRLPVAFVQSVLDSHEDLVWLDPEHEWFWVRSTRRNRLFTYIRKIVAVAGSIDVNELAYALARHPRLRGVAPPLEVLRSLCQKAPEFTIRRGRVVGRRPIPMERALGRVEHALAVAMRDHGPIRNREDQRRVREAAGIGHSTFSVYLKYSPIIVSRGPGKYDLIGR